MLAGAVVLGGLRVPGARGSTSVLHQLRVRNAAKSFVGDRRLFATISPRSGTGRAGAILDLIADKPLNATLEIVNRNGVGATVVSSQPVPLVDRQEPDSVGACPDAETRLVHPAAARSLNDTRTRARLGRRPRDGRRGDVPATERSRRRDHQPPRPERRALAAADAAPVRAGVRADQQQLRDARGPRRDAAADRSLGPPRAS